MKVTAVILSAGKGTRMGTEIPKQYMEIHEKPMLYYTLKAFENSDVDNIVIVAGEDDIDYVKENIVSEYKIDKVRDVVAGGAERYHSSYNGIMAADGADYVLLHDAARPCITPHKINLLIEKVKKEGDCILGVPVKDTIKIVDGNNVVCETPQRDKLWSIQTPQAFTRNDIVNAYRLMFQNDYKDITDDAMVMERFGEKKIKVMMGEYTNIKATTLEDMRFLEEFLKK